MDKVVLFLYQFLLGLFSLSLPILRIFNSKISEWSSARKGLFLKIKKWKIQDARPVILIHCASLGEYEQGHALIKKVKQLFPKFSIVVSFFSPSGYKNAQSDLADFLTYLPIDRQRNIRKFLEILQVKIALIIKNEFWPNLIQELDTHNIPTFYISTHLSNHSSYPKIFYNQLFRKIDHFFVQNRISANYLKERGVNNITITGDLRLLKSIENVSTSFTYPRLENASKPIIIYGSVWKEDWKVIKNYMLHHPQYLHVIAPHSLNQSSLDFFEKEVEDHNHIILIKEMGVLKHLYRYAILAYIGGAFGEGLHNILEPAAYSIPVIFGPLHNKFPEAQELINVGAAVTIINSKGLEEGMNESLKKRLVIKESLERYFAEKKPDLAVIMEKIENVLYE